MSKRIFALIFTLFIVTAVLAVITLYNPSSYDKAVIIPTSTIQPNNFPQTGLRFGPLEGTLPISSSSGQKNNYSISIIISSKSNKINTVQLELSYDPNILTQMSLAPGTFFPKPVFLLNQVDQANGRISYAIEAPSSEAGTKGTGVVAILTFQAKSSFQGKTTISFLPKTFVKGESANQSLLKETVSAQIVIGENIDK